MKYSAANVLTALERNYMQSVICELSFECVTVNFLRMKPPCIKTPIKRNGETNETLGPSYSVLKRMKQNQSLANEYEYLVRWPLV